MEIASQDEKKIMEQTISINTKKNTKKTWKYAMGSLFHVLDVLGITFIFFSIYYLRLQMEFQQTFSFSTNIPRFGQYLTFHLVFLVTYTIYKYKQNHLFNLSKFSLTDDFIFSIKEVFYSLLITVGISFFLKLVILSRAVILLFSFIVILYLWCTRTLQKAIIDSIYKNGYLDNKILIIGAGNIGTKLADEIESKEKDRSTFIGFLDDQKKGSNIIGKISDLNRICATQQIDEIYITIPSQRNVTHSLIKKMRRYDINIKIIPELYSLVTSTVEIGYMNALPYVNVVKTPMKGFNYFVKRTFDVLIGSLLLFILSPLLVMVSIMIMIDSKGNIFYKQRRIGKNGKVFNMYKFRSMTSNAEGLKELLKEQNEVKGNAFKIKDDPRITNVGRVLRKYSIDELPQLLNVLKGDMSLVGPRPPLPDEVKFYDDWEWRRLEVIPGITGLWQVSGRSELSFDQWVKLDIYYIENWSLILDIKLLLKTIPVVVYGKGAY